MRWSSILSRLLALLILAIVVASIYLMAVRPLTDRIAEAQEEIGQQRLLLGKLLAKAKDRTVGAVAPGPGFAPGFLDGGTEAARLAALQSYIEAAAENVGVRITSSQATPGRTEDRLAIIGVQVQASGGIAQLQGLLHALETGAPTLIVEQVDLVRSPVAAGEPERDLDLRMVVLGAARNDDGKG